MNHNSLFLEGRGILNVLVTNETINEVKNLKNKCFILKLDFEKAYDTIRWNYLEYMMQRLGFSYVWFRWIKFCLKSAIISILVNGCPTEEFIPLKGLKNKDPLASFLFVIVGQGLASVVRNAQSKYMLKGIKVGKNEVEVGFLQFVDDTIFLSQAETINIMMIRSILKFFELTSGSKVNFHKSNGSGRFA